MTNLVLDNGKTTYFNDRIIDVTIKVYDGCKYDRNSKLIAKVDYEIIGFGIYNGSDFSEDAYNELVNNDMIDEYDEYLKLRFADGDTALFRNSHVDMMMR